MRLLKLELTNFKGASNVIFEPCGNNTSVYGSNGTGKTTLFDALTWLLYDKPSDPDAKGFNPRTADADGNEIHNIDNSVCGTFLLPDGTVITFSKTLSEDWVAKRGESTKSLSGNRTAYAVDGVPVSKTEYDKRIAALCPPEKAQILTRPLHFPASLHWQKRREILMELCGDVSDADVIAATPELAPLSGFLRKPGNSTGFYTVDEYRKIADAQMKAADKRMKEIPNRIDEASRGLPDVSGLEETALRARSEELKKQRDTLLEERASLSDSDVARELRRQIAELRSEIEQGRAAFESKKNVSLADRRAAIRQLESQKSDALMEAMHLEAKIRNETSDLNAARILRDRLSAEYSEVRKSTYGGDTVCPTCGQQIPEAQIASAVESFNIVKARRLEEIRANVEKSCSKDAISALERQIAADSDAFSAQQAEVTRIAAQIDAAMGAIMPEERADYTETEEYVALRDRISAVEEQLSAGRSDASLLRQEVDGRLSAVQSELDAVERKRMDLVFYQQKQERISELIEEQKSIASECDRIKNGVHLCDLFVKTKVSMLNDRINSHFRTVHFRLFKQQFNSGLEERCDVMAQTSQGLKLFSDANDAAKLNAGLEIIDVLSRYWGIEMPVFVDNAESVVHLQEIAPQVIRLVVSEADERLRVEINSKGDIT